MMRKNHGDTEGKKKMHAETRRRKGELFNENIEIENRRNCVGG